MNAVILTRAQAQVRQNDLMKSKITKLRDYCKKNNLIDVKEFEVVEGLELQEIIKFTLLQQQKDLVLITEENLFCQFIEQIYRDKYYNLNIKYRVYQEKINLKSEIMNKIQDIRNLFNELDTRYLVLEGNYEDFYKECVTANTNDHVRKFYNFLCSCTDFFNYFKDTICTETMSITNEPIYQFHRGLRNHAVHTNPIINFQCQINSLPTGETMKSNFLYNKTAISKYQNRWRNNEKIGLSILKENKYPEDLKFLENNEFIGPCFCPSQENDVLKITTTYVSLIANKITKDKKNLQELLCMFNNIYKDIVVF